MSDGLVMIRGVTFDFGGTLASGGLDREVYWGRLLDYLRSMGFSGGEAQLRRVREGMFERLRRARGLNREIRFEDLYRGMLFRLGLHPEEEAIDYIHQLYIRSFKIELISGVEEVLEALKERYRLAVISNASSNVPRQAIKSFGLERYLDSIVISRDLGIRKPDPEIFRFALRNLGVESREAVHVGDSLKSDVRGAKEAGMKAVWLRRCDEETNFLPDYTIHHIKEIISILE